MRRDGLDFREALSRLAERAGVELSARTAGEDRRRRRLREALEAAIAWYREVLLQARQAERARAYLEERGLSAATQERFGIGYAPNTWEALSKRLRAKGFSDAELTDAGLASPSTRGGRLRPLPWPDHHPDPRRQRAGDRPRRPHPARRGGTEVPQLAGDRPLRQEPDAVRDRPRQGRDPAREARGHRRGLHRRHGRAPGRVRERRRQPRHGADRRPGRARQPLRRCRRAGL